MHKMVRLSGTLSILAAFSHVFCCGLPMAATLLSLGAVTGGALGLGALHAYLHAYENVIIVFSGLMLCLSFAALKLSERMDCSAQGDCCHEPCAPKKHGHRILFWVAFALFWVNFAVYLFGHNAPTYRHDLLRLHAAHSGPEAAPATQAASK